MYVGSAWTKMEKMESSYEEMSSVGACRDDGSAGVVRLVDLGEQVELGSVGLSYQKAGGGGGEVTGSDEIMDSVGDGSVMDIDGVMVKEE
eukprot:g29721.t1